MRRLEQLIDICRKETGNTRYEDSAFGSGIQQSVFVQHFRDAQDALYMHIVSKKTKFFRKTKTIQVDPMRKMYPWPDDIYVQALETLQWSDTRFRGTPITLKKSYTKELLSTRVGYAYSYIPSNEGVEMNPPVNYGRLHFTYERKLPLLQKRSGRITNVTMVGNTVTALTVDSNDKIYDESEINDDFFLCVVDKFGNVKALNIEYIDCMNGVFSMNPFDLQDGESIAVGDSILVGKNTCNIPDLPDICEGYLRQHVIYRVKMGDESSWTDEARNNLNAYLNAIDDSFGRLSEDITDIPITNYDYI